MNSKEKQTRNLNNTVIAIVGPTCSGKTSLSIKLAKELNGEIIACDSRNIYKQMDIGTAKPTLEEMEGIEHHMLDVAEPNEVYSVAQYKREAKAAIDSIFEADKVPIVCGGTGLYTRALLEGLQIPEVSPNKEFREELNKLADQNGCESLFQKLNQLDPEAAKKINQNDRFRIIRALEVIEELKIPFSEAIQIKPPPFNTYWIGLTFQDRSVLKERIIERLKIQIEDGLEAEVRKLYDQYGKTRTLTNAVTYKQFINYFENLISYDEAIDECIKHNYQLARKQIMWFRKNQYINWLNVDSESDLLASALNILDTSDPS